MSNFSAKLLTVVHIGVFVSFVVFLCAIKHVFYNLPYCQYNYLYLFYLIRTIQFSALHIILSFFGISIV